MTEPDKPVETLKSLIANHKGRRSYEDLARESGGRLGSTRWSQFGGPGYELKGAPTNDTVDTIARVLQIPVRRIWLAIGRELGHDVDGSDSQLVSRMPPGAELLSERQVDVVLRMIHELIEAQRLVRDQGAKVRPLRAARQTTGTESRGQRGGARTR